MTKLRFDSEYIRNANSFKANNGIELAVISRKPTLTKPSNFVVYSEPNSNRRFYWSALYPTSDPLKFNADFGGVKYLVEVGNDRLTVTQRRAK